MADPVGIILNIALQAVIGLIIAALTPKRKEFGPRLDDRQMTTSTYGEHLPIGYGTVILGGNVIWGMEIEEVAVTTEIGKGNPFSVGTLTQYYYYANFAVAFTRREVTSILKIYADGKLIYGGETINGVYEFVRMADLSFNFYYGTADQTADPLIAADVGVTDCPAFRHTCYIVFNRLPLANFGNRIPQIRVVLSFTSEQGQASYRHKIYQGGNLVINANMYDPERKLIFVDGQLPNNSGGFQSFAAINPFSGAVAYSVSTEDIADPWWDISISSKFRGGGDSPYIIAQHKDTSSYWRFALKSTLTAFGTPPPKFAEVSPSLWTRAVVVSTNADFSDNIYLGGIISEGDGNIVAKPKRGGAYDYYIAAGNRATWMTGRLDPTTISGVIANTLMDNTAHSLPFEVKAVVQGYQYLNSVTGDGTVDVIILWDHVFDDVNGPKSIRIDRIGALPTISNPTVDSFSLPGLWYFDSMEDGTNLIYCEGEDILLVTSTLRTRAYFLDSANNYQDRVLRWSLIEPSGGFSTMVDGGGHNPDSTTRVRGTSFPLYSPTGGVNGRIMRVDIRTGEVLEIRNAGPFTIGDGSALTAISRYNWDEELDGLMGLFDSHFLGPLAARGTENLQTVVEDIVQRSKLNLSDINASGLSSKEVRGYLLARPMTYRDALEPLATGYNFYGTEANGLMVFAFHDAVADLIIPEDDLLRSGFESIFEEARGQELETPRALFLTYRNPEQFDIKGTQIARRITTPEATVGSAGELSVELALTLNDAEGSQLAERLLYESWVQRESVRFRLPHRYLEILTNDNLIINAEGRIETIRVNRLAVGADLELEIEGVVVDGEVYTSRVTGVPPLGPPSFQVDGSGLGTATPPADVGAVQGFLIDSPLLRASDHTVRTTALIYFTSGVYILGTSYPGATLVTNYNAAGYVARASIGPPTGMAWGILTSVMPDIPHPAWNSVQEQSVTLTVYGSDSQFVSASEIDFIENDANNAMLIRADGRVEVISFRDAVFVSGSTYRLTGFMRGKRGTGTMAAGYSGLVYLVILTPAWLTAYTEALDRLAQDIDYRILPITSGTPAVPTLNAVYAFRSLMPFAPIHITRSDAGGNITIGWTRQDRLLFGWPDLTVNSPLNEDTQSFQIDILSGAGGVVMRTLISATTSVVYTSTDILYDFVSRPATLYVRVYQISGQVGRGFSYEAALTE